MRVTASKSGILAECQYFARDDVPWSERPDTLYSTRGTMEHTFSEHIIDGEEPDTTPRFRQAMRREVVEWLDIQRTSDTLSEVPFALDIATGRARRLPKTTHRAYEGALPHEFCGTADVVTPFRDYVEIFDFCYSWDGRTKIPQQRALCLMAARAFGVTRATYSIVRLSDAEPFIDVVDHADLDELELHLIHGEIRGRFAAAPDARPNPGRHCTYCPAKQACPETQAPVLFPQPAPKLRGLVMLPTPHYAGVRFYGGVEEEARLKKLDTVLDEIMMGDDDG
jgi:hypothetical protein